MITFYLNGKQTVEEKDENLLEYLRDQARLTSVKNGCMKGVCGACTVLIDGKGTRACLKKLSDVEGKRIVTTEGLSDYEKTVYTYAFGTAGAVQCGFCTPGMVMSAKALLDYCQEPDRAMVKKAIHGNLCRCTGYQKIEDAILLASEIFAGKKKMEKQEDSFVIGSRSIRIDAAAKTLGIAKYCDDIYMEGMLHAQVLFSRYPRAKILAIDVSKARQMPGVKAVMTASDIPGNRMEGYLVHDWPVMIAKDEITHYVGDVLAIIAAETKRQAQAAAKQIKIEYEELEPLTNPEIAMEKNALHLFPNGNIAGETHVKRNWDEKKTSADHCVEVTVRTPFTEHAFLEPESCVAYLEEGIVHIHTGVQSVHHTAEEVARILDYPLEKVRVQSGYVGGGFGGKEDLSVQAFASLLAVQTGLPVKLTFSREESLRMHPKRHPMELTLRLTADEKGNFTSLKAKVIADTGAYASLGPGVLQRACTHLCGPYKMPSVWLDGFAVYTNNPPAGAFRGFGVAQSAFALETAIDKMADELSMDYFAIRYQNVLEPGDVMGPGQLCGSDTSMKEVLDAIAPYYRNAKEQGKKCGLACGIKNAGMGVGTPDIGRANLKVEKGKIRLYTSAQCIGQGLDTVMLQIAAQVLKCSKERLDIYRPDSLYTPDAGATTASRQTVVTGEAVKRAAEALKEALQNATLADLEGKVFYGEFFAKTDPLNAEGVEHPYNHIAYSYAAHLAILDDQKRVEKIIAVHDVGKAINPLNVEGQIEGGIVMGMGYALTENFVVEKGQIQSSFAKLGLLRAQQVPEIISILVEPNCGTYGFSAKGIGEISTVPTAPAIAAAYRAVDGLYRLELPLEQTPYVKKGVKRS